MRFASTAAVLALTVSSSLAFSPSIGHATFTQRSTIKTASHRASPLKMAFDPQALASILLSDEGISAAADVAASTTGAAGEVVASSGNGWFGFLTVPIEGLLQILHSGLVSVGVDQNAWGVSIIVLTVLVKLLTYPLTASQLESTNKMQLLQPKIKQIQATYQSNPQVMNEKVAEIYQSEQVNPLAGCLPAIVQLPVFIGLYRAILELAKENVLSEPFLWLPNLEGPTYQADPAQGSDWILKGWQNGVPSLGWEDTTAFLILPVVLVISQFISQALITPKNQDPSQEQANVILKVLPLMIGWFSLNVPAALGIYWVANNIISTLITLQIRSGLETAPATASGSGSASSSTSTSSAPSSAFRPAPMREKPSGFAAPAEPVSSDPDAVKPITPVDAEIIEVESQESAGESPLEPAPTGSKKRGGKKKRKGGKN